MAVAKSLDFLPETFRTDTNQQFLSATVDQLIAEPQVKRLNGFIGRKSIPGYAHSDNYLPEISAYRHNYQLEPTVTVKDANNVVEFASTYQDLINKLAYYGAKINDHSRLFTNEFYTFGALIDFDKLVNFTQYYWLPSGPAVVNVFSNIVDPAVNYTVTKSLSTYGLSQNAGIENPTITLVRGGNYTFITNQPGSPFWLQSEAGIAGTQLLQSNISTRDVLGVSNNGTDVGTVTFNVPLSTDQDIYSNMLVAGSANLVTTLHYSDIANSTMSAFIAAFGGISGNTNIVGKRIIFTGAQSNNSFWTHPVTNSIVPTSQRFTIWQIDGTADANPVLSLSSVSAVQVSDKINIIEGLQAGKAYFKDGSGVFVEVPLLTASLDTLFYQDGSSSTHVGTIRLVDPIISVIINVDNDIINQVNYTSPNGVVFTNGLKIRFNANVLPATYANIDYYVEGVGKSIQLVPTNLLITPESHVTLVGSDITAPEHQDYLTINRASTDLNPWARSNRWFHETVIEVTATYNGTTAILNQTDRARRPIIEFDANLQLSTFGSNGKVPVTLIDTTQTDVFSNIEAQASYTIDGVLVAAGMRIVFANDLDTAVTNNIYVASWITPNSLTPGLRQLHFEKAVDGNIGAGDVVVATSGINLGGISFYYNGTAWVESQQKTSLNQAPLYDMVDAAGHSLTDFAYYPDTNFAGTKIFSFKEGRGSNDPILGIPLSYQSVNNIGDIVFQNHIDTDTFSYTANTIATTNNVNVAYIKKNSTNGTATFVNMWEQSVELSSQPQTFLFFYTGNTRFQLDINPNIANIVPTINVFVNAVLLDVIDFVVENGNNGYYYVVINNITLVANDKIDILVTSSSQSPTGFYTIPVNLDNNSVTELFASLTLGQMRKHIGMCFQNNTSTTGVFPGISNIRDTDISTAPGNVLQHSASLPYSELFLVNNTTNFVNALEMASSEYARFKNKFIDLATKLTTTPTDISATVDQIIETINAVKTPAYPYFYSDMLPCGQLITNVDYTILDTTLFTYEITALFDITVASNKAVLLYYNSQQLMYGRDYTFNTDRAAITLTSAVTLNMNDALRIVEYNNTDGCWIPETPTKMGMFAKFTPGIVLDNTYRTPINVIHGHDGSITPAFNDYRDDLILELELRIYNNIKIVYDPQRFNFDDIVPGAFRTTDYTANEVNDIVSRTFLQWAGANRLNYTSNDSFVASDPFTWNYSKFKDILTLQLLPGHWRAVFYKFYDTDKPHTHPWEMLGFSEQPAWWEAEYGALPYTAGNLVMWDDLSAGKIRNGARAGIDARYVRPSLTRIIPVDAAGTLLAPAHFLVTEFSSTNVSGNFAVGDRGPVENAWARSSNYPFAMQLLGALTKPAKYFGLMIDTENNVRDPLLGQYVSKITNTRHSRNDVQINGELYNGKIARSASYLNWIADNIRMTGQTPAVLRRIIATFTVQLAYKLAGFSDKTMLTVLAEQASPNSTSDSIVVPAEDYTLHLIKSPPINKLTYSAVIVQKTANGYTVEGYDLNNPFFTVIPSNVNGNKHEIKVLRATGVIYNDALGYRMSIPYGHEFANRQQVVDFLISYERALVFVGFDFSARNIDLGETADWTLSVKEFLYWAQQGWQANSIIVLSPVYNTLTVTTINSVIDEVTNDQFGSRVSDINFSMLNNTNYAVTRNGTTCKIVLTNNAPIGLVELNAVQYEHILILENTTIFNDVIYQPALGNRQGRVKLVGVKTDNWTGELNAPGFVLSNTTVATWQGNTDYRKGDLVIHKNKYYTARDILVANSIFNFADWIEINKSSLKQGLLPNFATRATQSQGYYDVDSVGIDPAFDLFGKGLIGFRPRQYLTDTGVDNTSQLKFYQGMIKTKGTKNSLLAMNSGAFNKLNSEITFYEEWGIRTGAYGATDSTQVMELLLNEANVTSNPSFVTLLNDADAYTVNNIGYKQADLYKTPANFKKNLFGTIPSHPDALFKLPTAGYPRVDDVDFTVFDIANASELNAAGIGTGSIVWTANGIIDDWNIYRATTTNTSIITVTSVLDGLLQFTTNEFHNFIKNDVIVINNITGFNGVYTVTDASSNTTFLAAAPLTLDPAFIELTAVAGYVLKLESVRFAETTLLADYAPGGGWKAGDLVWVDAHNEIGNWAVYQKSLPWQAKTSITPVTHEIADGAFGQALSVEPAYCLVGQPKNGSGNVITYTRDSVTGTLTPAGAIAPSVLGTNGFGASIVSAGAYSIIGAPNSDTNKGYAYVINYNGNTFDIVQSLSEPAGAPNNMFGASVAISTDTQWMFIAAPGANLVYVYTFFAGSYVFTETLSGFNSATNDNFGFSIATNTDGSNVVIGAPQHEDTTLQNTGAVYTFNRNSVNQFIFAQKITIAGAKTQTNVGHSVAIANDNLYVGAPNTSGTFIDSGVVYHYIRDISGVYQIAQTIANPLSSNDQFFGQKIATNATGTIITIASPYAITYGVTTFDSNTTILDNASTLITDKISTSGSVCVFEIMQNAIPTRPSKYVFSHQLESSVINSFDLFGSSTAIIDNDIYVGSPATDAVVLNGGSVIHFATTIGQNSWALYRTPTELIDQELINKIYLYNTSTSSRIVTLDFIDPIKGKILGVAQQDIDFISKYDPAVYNATNALGANNFWEATRVGKVWWDLRQLRYLNYDQGDFSYKSRNWGKLFPGSSADVYEWIESDVLPSVYVAESREGMPKYADDSSYSTFEKIDPATDRTVIKYYYWVKGLTSVATPDVRTLSVNTIAELIVNPSSQGLSYAAIIAADTVGLYNVGKQLVASDVSLHIDYDIKRNENNIHSEYILLQEGNESATVPAHIITKLVDSLCGVNTNGDIVPDPNLSAAEKYGILFRPRQSMFKDRLRAVQSLVDFINAIFAKTLINSTVNTIGLNDTDSMPTIASNTYQESVATLTELTYIPITTVPLGYKVLVESDSTQNNQWAIYEKSPTATWDLVTVQAYNVPLYWANMDWYATGFNPASIARYVVETENDIAKLGQLTPGDVLKINNNGKGQFELYLVDSAGTIQLVGMQNGTIQLLPTLATNTPAIELRKIINTLINNVFIGNLAIEFNNMIFMLLRFVLIDQNNTDWLFKTSFITILHKIRKLLPYPNYQKDNQTFLLDYINEVKPYRTKVREYLLDYSGSELWNGNATDFDLPAYFDAGLTLFRSPNGEQPGDATLINTALVYTEWANHHYLHLGSVTVNHPGINYTTVPTITITGGGGFGATAYAVISNGAIDQIIVTNPGLRYTSQPVITITGGAGTGAAGYPVMANDLTRQVSTTIKFDRITYAATIANWTASTALTAGQVITHNYVAYMATIAFTTAVFFNELNLVAIRGGDINNAVDRVAAYYAPTPGMLGNVPAQLFSGIEYPGVQIIGNPTPGFDVSGYDSLGYSAFTTTLADGTIVNTDNQFDTLLQSFNNDTLLGTRAADIIVDGGAYVDTYSGHAPEELIPGKVYDTIDIQVFTVTGNDIANNGAGPEVIMLTQNVTPATTSMSYAVPGKEIDYAFVYTATLGHLTVLVDYTIDYSSNQIIFTTPFIAADIVTIYAMNNVGNGMVFDETLVGDVVTNSFYIGIPYVDVQQASILVTVNGVKTEAYTLAVGAIGAVGTQIAFTTPLSPADRAHVSIFTDVLANGPGFTYNEIHTQLVTVPGAVNYTIDLLRNIHNRGPLSGQVIVELNNKRLRPSTSQYYVTATGVTYNLPTTTSVDLSLVASNEVLVFVSNRRATNGVDYQLLPFDANANARAIAFLPGFTPVDGTNVTVSLTTNTDYTFITGTQILINNTRVTLAASDIVKIITFSNHDSMLIRTQVFVGLAPYQTANPALIIDKPIYSLSRVVTNLNYLWVTVNGVKMLQNYDYTIATPLTAPITMDSLNITADNAVITTDIISTAVAANADAIVFGTHLSVKTTDEIIITSFTENVQHPTIGYRIFTNMLGTVDYLRISKFHTTELTNILRLTDLTIVVDDATVLPTPDIQQTMPGVININGERITYWQIDVLTNTISQIARGTGGTSVPATHSVGSRVVDTGPDQRIPGNAATQHWTALPVPQSYDRYPYDIVGYGTIIPGHKELAPDAAKQTWYTPVVINGYDKHPYGIPGYDWAPPAPANVASPADSRGLLTSNSIQARFLKESQSWIPKLPASV